MKQIFIFGVLVLFLISLVSATSNNTTTTNVTEVCSPYSLNLCLDEINCTAAGGGWDNGVCCYPISISQWCPNCNVEEKGNDCLCPMAIDGRGCSTWDCDSCTQTINETCVGEGEEGNMIINPNTTCCPGLTMLANSWKTAEGECVQPTDGSFICSKCGNDICGPGENECNCPEDCEISDKICCHKFGYGNQMKKVNSQYQWIDRESCVTPEGFVGGGREIVENEFCENQTKKKLKPYYDDEFECPENCTCTGSVTKCQINGGREMTVRAGKSGNIIVQVKGVNMTTNVTLYKSEGKVYGVFKNNQTRIIKILPDEVKEKIRQRIRAKLESHNITLDEDGIYQVQTKKRARLFFLIPVREKVRAQINSETGEVIKIRNPWWGFLARDVKEDLVGGCGTVTPGMEDECCQNLGYDSWNSESLECE